MPYVPKSKHLFKILFRRRDQQAAEELWLEGTWQSDNGDPESARMAFNHSRILDPEFAGAFYNYAALTEKLKGMNKESLKAWEDYLRVAPDDKRQTAIVVEQVRAHVEQLKKLVNALH